MDNASSAMHKLINSCLITKTNDKCVTVDSFESFYDAVRLLKACQGVIQAEGSLEDYRITFVDDSVIYGRSVNFSTDYLDCHQSKIIRMNHFNQS